MRLEKQLDEANEKILDLTSRSMRDNLIFKNVPEKKGETSKDLEKRLTQFFKEDLKINKSDIKLIEIERIHRVGKANNDRCRNVVTKLSSKGKSMIMSHLKHLDKANNQHIKVTEQFPPEINAHRNKLWPQFIEAKKQGKNPKWKVDKRVVNQQVYSPPKDKIRDINLDCTQTAVQLRKTHTAVESRDGSHFQGHTVDITSVDEDIPAIQSLCADTRVAGATHLMDAYKVGRTDRYISNFEDDGEWGAGRRIMEVLNEHNIYNRLVAATRWYGGKHIGPARFDIISKLSNLALDTFYIHVQGYRML